jgi:hypothetical protein
MRKFYCLLVIAILFIICIIFLPALFPPPRIGAGETSPIGTLKALSAGQEQFRTACVVDINGNGIGEYGLMDELSGASNCRGSGINVSTSPYIPTIFKSDSLGRSSKSGYYYICYLPGKISSWSNAYPIIEGDPSKQEELYVMYAFPITYGRSGNRIFAISPSGTIMQLPNKKGKWGGVNVPPPGLAFKYGLDPSLGSGIFVESGDFGGAKEAWRPIGCNVEKKEISKKDILIFIIVVSILVLSIIPIVIIYRRLAKREGVRKE